MTLRKTKTEKFKFPVTHKLLNILAITFLPVFYVIPTIYGMAFLHSNLGVVFSPYVHNEVDYENITHDWLLYKMSEVKTMAKLISTRFPKLVTYGIGSRWTGSSDKDSYSWGRNYYECFSQVFVCEAVASVNNATYYEMEENKEKGNEDEEEDDFHPLQVYQGVHISLRRLRVDLELNIAIEAIQKANRIFPGTVTGIVFYSEIAAQDDYGNATLILDAMKKIEFKAAQHKIKIGTKQNCEYIYEGTGDIGGKRRQIVEHSNFIICEIMPDLEMNVTEAVVWVIKQIIRYRKEIKTLNPWIDVMFETGWAAEEGDKPHTKSFLTFWEYLESWSLANDVSLWLNEAFDTPWSYGERIGYFGWWRLKDDQLTGEMEGYIEKIPHNGTKFKKKNKGKALAFGRRKIQKIEKLIPPVLAFGRLQKPKGPDVLTEVKEGDEEVYIPES